MSLMEQPLFDAAARGDNAMVLKALNGGIDIHADNDKALFLAAQNGHLETVKLLISNKANIHADDERALCWAARNGHQDIVAWLLDCNADISIEGHLPLCLAAGNGHTKTVALLLDRGADIHAENDMPLIQAAEHGHVKTVELLLDRGADIHADHDAPLRQASIHNRKDTAILLLRRGADPHARNDEGADSFKGTKLAQWLHQMEYAVQDHFRSPPPSRAQCLVNANGGSHRLHNHVIDACLTNQFVTLVGMPLIESASTPDRQLFQDIWDGLPEPWQAQHQNLYMKFAKEGGVNPPAQTRRRIAGRQDRRMGR